MKVHLNSTQVSSSITTASRLSALFIHTSSARDLVTSSVKYKAQGLTGLCAENIRALFGHLAGGGVETLRAAWLSDPSWPLNPAVKQLECRARKEASPGHRLQARPVDGSLTTDGGGLDGRLLPYFFLCLLRDMVWLTFFRWWILESRWSFRVQLCKLARKGQQLYMCKRI